MKRPIFSLLLSIPLLLMGCIEFISPQVSDLAIILQNPGDSLFTDREIIHFRWEQEDLAEAYQFQLYVTEGANQYLLLDTLLSKNNYRLKLDEGCYSWKVRAYNESSFSTFQARDFFIDQSPPMVPQAIHPLPGDTIFQASASNLLQWQSGDLIAANVFMSVSDSLYLYNWRGGWPVFIRGLELAPDQEKAIHLPEVMEEMKPGEYRWEIKSFDQVGHETCSRLFHFFLQ
jgi:hypothetical protein